MNNDSTSIPFTKVNITLTSEAIDFLSETTNGTSYFAILGQMIRNASITPSSISKRGNVITLDVGQVECSVHSCCTKFGIGRKKFEAIMHKMEQHGIIRMHRSRLATIADMNCITSWLLPNGSTMTNENDSHTDDDNSDADSDLGSQSPSNTDHASVPEKSTVVTDTATPVSAFPSNPVKVAIEALCNRSESLIATGQNAHKLQESSLSNLGLEELEKPLSQNATPLQNE